MKGKLEISGENACLLYAPQECQDYQAVQKFRNSYVHFSTDLPFADEYGIPTSILLYPENFMELDEYIRLIQQEYLTRPPFFQERCRLFDGGAFSPSFQKSCPKGGKGGPGGLGA
ncbi:MAG: hypothetical protein ACLR2E_05285 [Lachnospiraceae bacterium]